MSDSEPKPLECAVALIVRDGSVLLGFRSPDRDSYHNVWDLFGGHAEAGETIEQTLVRELQEELNVTPLSFEPIGAFREPDPDANGEMLYTLFKVTRWIGPGPALCGDEHVEIRWHTLEEALTQDLALPIYRDVFRRHLRTG